EPSLELTEIAAQPPRHGQLSLGRVHAQAGAADAPQHRGHADEPYQHEHEQAARAAEQHTLARREPGDEDGDAVAQRVHGPGSAFARLMVTLKLLPPRVLSAWISLTWMSPKLGNFASAPFS